MRIPKTIVALWLVLAAGASFAQQTDLTGTWTGRIAVDANTSLALDMRFTRKPDGSYDVVLNSTDNPAIRNVAATGVTWAPPALKLQVPSLSGSYAATLKDGKLDGSWTQQGTVLPLVLSPTRQAAAAGKAAVDALIGTWSGPATLPAGKLTFVYRFSRDSKGELRGTIAVQEQGGNEIPISEILFSDDRSFTAKIAAVRAEFSGTLANGQIAGTFRQGGVNLPLTLRKGEVAAPNLALKLDAAAAAALVGKWTTTIAPPPNAPPNAPPVNVVLTIEKNAAGDHVAFLQNAQAPVRIPVTEMRLAAADFTMRAAGALLEFTGKLDGRQIVGTWKQGPNSLPVTLQKQ